MMCGICGFVSLEGLPEEGKTRSILEAMTGKMVHRGPDDSGFYQDSHAALGFRRLCIIDLHTGRQPLANENSQVFLVFNGEIYNFPKLRRELQGRGHIFRSQTDSEVIVHLYEELGEGCLNELRGMFSFALWDKARQKLLLARDRFGIKPLYYTSRGGTLLFASEVKALLEYPGLKAELNPEALPHYLTFQYVPDPQSIFKGISRLRPAHCLLFDRRGITEKRYWQLHFRPDKSKPLDYFVEQADHLLREAVRMHMLSDVPRGAFLSSGVDSSTVAALFSRIEPVQTFSVGCAGGKYDELPRARETAKLLGARHREIQISAAEFWSCLPRIIWRQEEPVADPSAAALYFVARLAAEDVRVVLSGEGADEAFGGYDIYREPAAVAPLQMLPLPFKKILGQASRLLPDGFKGKNYLRRGATPLEMRYYGNAFIYTEEEKRELLNPELFPGGWAPPWLVTAPIYRRSPGLDGATRMQQLDFATWLPGDILAKADRMTMAHSLELRVPFLDHHLVEFAATIPPRYKIRGSLTKYLLRQVAARYLPPEICRRPKLGFPVPVAAWIRDHYAPALRELFRSEAARNYFNPALLEGMLEAHCRGAGDYARRLWTAAVFLIWHSVCLCP